MKRTAVTRGNLLASRRWSKDVGGTWEREKKARQRCFQGCAGSQLLQPRLLLWRGEADESTFSGEEQIDRDRRTKDVGERDTGDSYREQATDLRKREAAERSVFYNGESKARL